MKVTFQLIGVLAIVAALPRAFAQPAGMPPPPPGNEPTFLFRSTINGDQTFEYVASGMRIDGGVVKNAPYSAQAITESTQTLPDGNRISRKTSASLYRDSEGRTRREETMGMGASINGEPVQSVFINDPVAGTSLVLDPRNKVARSMPPMKMPPLPPGPPPDGAGNVMFMRSGAFSAAAQASPDAGMVAKKEAEASMLIGPGLATATLGRDAQKESLGTQVIEGVQAEGTRTTMTIPAGAIGNDLPIKIVSERWYSPELKTVVMSRHSDPRMGDTVYQLTNVNRSEPARSMFEAPGDYTFAAEGKPVQMKVK
jgi:hypothetical protein